MEVLRIAGPPDPTNMTFFKDNKECGKLSWKDGTFRFEGNADDSAASLFIALQQFFWGEVSRLAQVKAEMPRQERKVLNVEFSPEQSKELMQAIMNAKDSDLVPVQIASDDSVSVRAAMRDRIAELEAENARLKLDLDRLRRRKTIVFQDGGTFASEAMQRVEEASKLSFEDLLAKCAALCPEGCDEVVMFDKRYIIHKMIRERTRLLLPPKSEWREALQWYLQLSAEWRDKLHKEWMDRAVVDVDTTKYVPIGIHNGKVYAPTKLEADATTPSPEMMAKVDARVKEAMERLESSYAVLVGAKPAAQVAKELDIDPTPAAKPEDLIANDTGFPCTHCGGVLYHVQACPDANRVTDAVVAEKPVNFREFL